MCMATLQLKVRKFGIEITFVLLPNLRSKSPELGNCGGWLNEDRGCLSDAPKGGSVIAFFRGEGKAVTDRCGSMDP